MKEKEFSVEDFLNRHHLSLDKYDYSTDLEVYLEEMQKGLDSESSIPMLPTYIEENGTLPVDKPVLVLDAGGTNFRAAIVSFTEDKSVKINNFKKRGMPGFERELSKAEFFDAIADFISDLAVNVDRIGFCFSYPMVKTSEKDGRLIGFSKEIKAEEVIGELIGAGVIEALSRKGINNIKKIILLNDTVATLLAGKAYASEKEYDTYVGFIYGTGVNASYNEKNSKIGKIPELPADGSQLINMEAGSCAIFASGDIDADYRSGTARPNNYIFEKMVSGGYLGQLWFHVIRTASEEGCFSDGFRAALENACVSGEAGTYDASVLSRFLADDVLPKALDGRAGADDTGKLLAISNAVIHRAAYLASVMMTAILVKTGKGKTPEHPVCVCVDGTTFWKLHGLKELVIKNMDNFTAEAGVYYKIIKIENAPVIGAAVAGLTNN